MVYIILVSVLIAFIISDFNFHKKYKKEYIMEISIIAFIIFITISIILSPIFYILNIKYDGIEVKKDYPIYSVKNFKTLNGNFFIGTGYIEGQEKYSLFIKNTNNSYTKMYIPVEKTEIFLDESKNPYLTYTKCYPKINFWTFKLDENSCKNIEIGEKYILHIPPNSIIKEFKVD